MYMVYVDVLVSIYISLIYNYKDGLEFNSTLRICLAMPTENTNFKL